MNVALAEALLRRKELQEKVNQVAGIKAASLYDLKVKRVNVSESIDDLTAHVPLLTLSEVTREYDYYARQLRMIDGVIQRANWETTVDIKDCMEGYDASKDPLFGKTRGEVQS